MENEWTQVATSTSYGTVNSVVFKIPNTALSGDTRMRIRTNYSWYSNTSTDATSTFYYGSTEDYTITVQAQTQSIPKTDFAASETNICLGSTVQFTDNSTGVPATISSGTGCTAVTPTVFCTVMAVMAVMP
jgi:PKD repeat protein